MASTDVAVFDLDGTLVRGDSLRQFNKWLLRRGRVRHVISFLTSPIFNALMAMRPTHMAGHTMQLWFATFGLSEDGLTTAAEEFAALHAGPDSGNLMSATLNRLSKHLDDGDTVIVATGTLRPLAEALCRQIGLTGVHVLASTLRKRVGGHVPDQHCFAETKVDRLRDAGFSLPIAYAYSDSPSDIPLLRAARHGVVVDPDPRHIRRIQQATGHTCEVLWNQASNP
ncbi:HAD family hydrolase [Nonomuraea guangzhouensis]|uniref:HAD family hydrolase n=1 Tax=Nonomuraea guangzhouensis TaxID=1291555 RepID=A0ABW4G468_9ACTN|nr:haloacid dehalogenase-like hydrolase [Nonomuraea guangzhouensis]